MRATVSVRPPPETIDLSPYYDVDYYSFQDDGADSISRFFRRRRDASYFGGLSPIGEAVRRFKHDPLLVNLGRVGLNRDQRIFNVGCGAGNLLNCLAAIGFRSSREVDPFSKEPTTTPNGEVLEKIHPRDLLGTFEVIMLHHSHEHILDPCHELPEAGKCLAPGGFCVVRLPAPSSEAFSGIRRGLDTDRRPAPYCTSKPRGYADSCRACRFPGTGLRRRQHRLLAPRIRDSATEYPFRRYRPGLSRSGDGLRADGTRGVQRPRCRMQPGWDGRSVRDPLETE